jgi:hypothetical protein
MIGGVIPVLYSFYGKSGTLDLDAHEQQIDWGLAQQASGVTLLGLASESGIAHAGRAQGRAEVHCATFASGRDLARHHAP